MSSAGCVSAIPPRTRSWQAMLAFFRESNWDDSERYPLNMISST
jgi:hypothetical protein